MNKVKIGLFGLGTVGQGIIKLLNANREYIERQCSAELVLEKVVVRDIKKPRDVDTKNLKLSTDPAFILEDPEINICLEMLGGQTLAADVLFHCLDRNIRLITANKALLAEQALKINEHNQQGLLFYEASIAGNIPIVRSMAGLKASPIEEIKGILNGTANYILTHITDEQLKFKQALQLAQQKGYAEADPSLDIQGTDVAHKLILLMQLAFDGIVNYHSLSVEGIEHLNNTDIQYAKEMGYATKLLAKATRTAGGIMAYVRPVLIPQEHLLAQVKGVYNAVVVKSHFGGMNALYGLGAGAEPTASAVIADLISAVSQKPTPQPALPKIQLLASKQNLAEFYVRFSVRDRIGVIAKISSILQEQKISIRELVQKKHSSADTPADIILITHQAEESKIHAALSQINNQGFILEPAHVIQLEADHQKFV